MKVIEDLAKKSNSSECSLSSVEFEKVAKKF
jgi:hypothetical protein